MSASFIHRPTFIHRPGVTRRTTLGLGAAAGLVAATGLGVEAARAEPRSSRAWVFTRSTFHAGNRTIRLHHLREGRNDFFTAGAAEAELLRSRLTYVAESSLWVYCVTDPADAPPNSKPLQRLWNASVNRHLFTIDEAVALDARRHGWEPQAQYPTPYLLSEKPKSTSAPVQRLRLREPR